VKRGSARIIIALVALAAILALCAYAVPSIAICRLHFVESYCEGLRMRLYFEVAAVLALAIAAWIGTRQMDNG
jgi:hypothetical protein